MGSIDFRPKAFSRMQSRTDLKIHRAFQVRLKFGAGFSLQKLRLM